MLAIVAALAFLVAVIVAEAGTDFLTLGYPAWVAVGLLLLALHLVVPVAVPWRRTP